MTSVALIGLGPRGLVVLDRFVSRLADRSMPAVLHLIDPGGPGEGPVWSVDQPEHLLMNTDLREVTLFPGSPPDTHGFAAWLARWRPAARPRDGVVPRAWYGRYLRWAYRDIMARVPDRVRVVRWHTEATGLVPDGPRYDVELAEGGPVKVDAVVLCTGYGSAGRPDPPPDPDRPGLEVWGVRGLPALSAVPPGAVLGVVGMGLGFFDALAGVTEARGGIFEEAGGRLKYRPSGAEPVLYAGCRSGVPARSKISAAYLGTVRPAVLTAGSVRAALAAPDPARALYALLDREFNATRRAVAGRPLARRPLRDMLEPFRYRRFAAPELFQAAAMQVVAQDIGESSAAWSTEKVGFAALRAGREVVRRAVESGALHDPAFRAGFAAVARVYASLVGGPPAFRIRQLAALVDAGVVRLVGPDVRLDGNHLWSPRVAGSRVRVDAVVQARLPDPSTVWRRSPLLTRLADLAGGTVVDPVTLSPDLRVVDRSGRLPGPVHLVGYPAEGQRWFTQVGSAAPGADSVLTEDADRVVAHLVP